MDRNKELEVRLEIAKLQSEITKLEQETRHFRASTPAWGISGIGYHPEPQPQALNHVNEEPVETHPRTSS